MRIAGYVRESADPSDDRPAFTQQEELRRFAGDHGHNIVAICQDLRAPGAPPSRDGYLSLLGVVASGGVEAVLVPGIATFSSDAIVQEIMLWDLQARGVRLLSTVAADLALLDPEAVPEPSRMVIRDVLERVGEHAAGLGAYRMDPPGILPDGDVLVHIIEADAAEGE
ncbi:MAG: recombinase family protein [Acidimicrobiia bacterium]